VVFCLFGNIRQPSRFYGITVAYRVTHHSISALATFALLSASPSIRRLSDGFRSGIPDPTSLQHNSLFFVVRFMNVEMLKYTFVEMYICTKPHLRKHTNDRIRIEPERRRRQNNLNN
jgi:hypothetical protein